MKEFNDSKSYINLYKSSPQDQKSFNSENLYDQNFSSGK